MEILNEHRLVKGFPGLFLLPDVPFWFVVDNKGEEVLDGLKQLRRDDIISALKARGLSHENATFEADHFLSCMTIPPIEPYRGRCGLELRGLRELWFHLLDHCNLECSHCLFSAQRKQARILDPTLVVAAIDQARSQGLALCCFTGGEPLLYPQFGQLLDLCTRVKGLDVAILTNGTLCRRFLKENPSLMRERIHFQVSIDGPGPIHDKIRGPGAFSKTKDGVAALLENGFSVTASLCVNSVTFPHLLDTLDTLKGMGIEACHLMWHFDQGAGKGLKPILEQGGRTLFRRFLKKAYALGICIDNLDAISSQLFSPPGTRFDLGNAGWESVCIGPDGTVWPTPAKVDSVGFSCGKISTEGPGILDVWQKSELLNALRETSLLDSPYMAHDPWRLVLGGGDIDHAMRPVDRGVGFELASDPNRGFYMEMVQYLIQRELNELPETTMHLGIRLKMGDVMGACGKVDKVNFTHSNCLLSLGKKDGRTLVREFYMSRAITVDEAIKNPFMSSGLQGISFIPEKNIQRSYGCGSPMEDAGIRTGEHVCDLGSGAGVECFIAAKKVGRQGRVFGIDMTHEMLALADSAKKEVIEELGYENVFFVKAHLEDLPFKENAFNCITSNCVLNLTRNKRRVLAQALKALKPGGRIVISDVVVEHELPPWIRGDKQLVGQCLGGALVESYLYSMLRDLGFKNISPIKRFPYKKVQGNEFYSLTFKAERIENDNLSRGGVHLLKVEPIGITGGNSPCCTGKAPQPPRPYLTGCIICGAPLQYIEPSVKAPCVVCGTVHETKVLCANGHFCCDGCHMSGPLGGIKEKCLGAHTQDMITLMKEIREGNGFPVHGPEHHAMVPGIIVATYRNLGGDVSDQAIMAAIEQGARIPGGACGYMGACGAAIGVGVGFSTILRSTPLSPRARALVNRVVAEVLFRISERDAARCCQRESYIALKEAARLSAKYLPKPLVADEELMCKQFSKNKECIRKRCPLFPGSR